MKIAIAGTGYVGLVTGVCLAEIGHDVTCIDIDPNKIEFMRGGKSPIYEAGLEELMLKNAERLHYTTEYAAAYRGAEIIFVAVGTPEKKDGSANLKFVYEVCGQIAESVETDKLVVIKSTVPIGTNDKIEAFINSHTREGVSVEVVSNPEFLSQGTAVRDTLHGARVVIGAKTEEARATMARLYEGFHQPFVLTDRRSAEMIKYASNDFLALKISYINEIANVCELVGANIEDVARGMGYDPRIGSRFLNAGIGYGGSCFPKDTKALHWLANYYDYEIKTIRAAIDVNENQKIRLIKKARKYYESMSGLTVAVLGLTFKPGTDDLRDAPSLQNIPILLDDGAVVRAYDPVGEENFKKKIPEGIIYCDSPEQALLNADICFIFTEWDEVKKLEAEKFEKLMKSPIVLDGRNCYAPESFKGPGVFYESIGRSPVYPAEGYEAPRK